MTKKMAICNIQYTYESYVGIDVEKLAWKIHDYVQQEFAEYHPLVSEPGNGVEMPDYVDITIKKNDGFFIEADIRRRAVNIPRECQKGELVLKIFIKNSDGTSFHFKHQYPSYNWEPKERTNPMRHLKIQKTITKRAEKESDKAKKGKNLL